MRISKGATYVSVGWNILLLQLLGIWGLFALQSRIVMISWKNNLGIRKPAKYLFLWWILWMYLSRLANGYCSGSVSSLRVSGCKRSETQAKSLVSFQSFCAIVSPHRMRIALCLPANYCFCRVKNVLNLCNMDSWEVTVQVTKAAFELRDLLPWDTRFQSRRNSSDLGVILRSRV